MSNNGSQYPSTPGGSISRQASEVLAAALALTERPPQSREPDAYQTDMAELADQYEILVQRGIEIHAFPHDVPTDLEATLEIVKSRAEVLQRVGADGNETTRISSFSTDPRMRYIHVRPPLEDGLTSGVLSSHRGLTR